MFAAASLDRQDADEGEGEESKLFHVHPGRRVQIQNRARKPAGLLGGSVIKADHANEHRALEPKWLREAWKNHSENPDEKTVQT